MKKSILLVLMATMIFSCKKDDEQPTPVPVPDPLPEEFAAFGGLFDGNGVGAAVNLHEDVLLLFNIDGDRYAWFEENEIKAEYAVNDNNGPLGDYAFNSVGAAAVLASTTLYLLDGDGDRYHTASFDPENIEGSFNNDNSFSFSPTNQELYEWGPDNTCPFNEIGAIWTYTYPGNDCFDASIANYYYWMVNGNGDQYVRYYSPIGGDFEPHDELENWIAENNCGGPDGLLPFESISAACRYVLPNRIQEIFFSADGKQFAYYTVSEGEFSEIYNLY